MNVFKCRDHLVRGCGDYVRRFIALKDPRIQPEIDHSLTAGVLWPEPRIALNPYGRPPVPGQATMPFV